MHPCHSTIEIFVDQQRCHSFIWYIYSGRYSWQTIIASHSLNIGLVVLDCIIDLYCVAVMFQFVVLIRTCSKCHKKKPLFDKAERRLSYVNEKNKGGLTYIVPPQDCYSPRCIFSSEHSNTCSFCQITSKQTLSKKRKIQGGSPSYTCDMCVSSPQ